MPDFRQAIEQANFKPSYTTNSTTGPNAEGQEQTWQNPNPQLEQSSAQELASLLGATLSEVNYSGGPYSQQKPQYQIDFGANDDYDASMVYDRYQRSPGSFNQQTADEIKSSNSPSVAAQEFAAGKLNSGGGFGGHPGAPAPGGGTPGTPYTPPPANIPGPNWGNTSPPPNIPGPNVPVNPLPGPTGVPPVNQFSPGATGGYTSPAHELPRIPGSRLLNEAIEIKGMEVPDYSKAGADVRFGAVPANTIKPPGLLASATPEGYSPPRQVREPKLGGLLTPAQWQQFARTGKDPSIPTNANGLNTDEQQALEDYMQREFGAQPTDPTRTYPATPRNSGRGAGY